MNACCKDCPDRRIGCHDVHTCSKWAEHEKDKAVRYKERLKRNDLNHYITESKVRQYKRGVNGDFSTKALTECRLKAYKRKEKQKRD